MSGMAKMYWLRATTPLHIGAGRGVGFIDLPIMREKITQWPMAPGSTVKGVWKDHFREKPDRPTWEAAFGKDTQEDNDHASALVVTDARIVLFPVRSFHGTFAYATSPLALSRLRRDLEAVGVKDIPPIPADLPMVKALTYSETDVSKNNKVYFEDLDFESESCGHAIQWANLLGEKLFAGDEDWKQIFLKRFVILPDEAFDFLCEAGTEVNARIRIDPEHKIVKEGALWYEESLPVETVLAGIIWCERVFANGGKYTPDHLFKQYAMNAMDCQIGGKATVGKGRVHCRFTGKGG